MENKKYTITVGGQSMGKSEFPEGFFDNIDYTTPKQSDYIFGDFSEITMCNLERTPEERKELMEKSLNEINVDFDKIFNSEKSLSNESYTNRLSKLKELLEFEIELIKSDLNCWKNLGYSYEIISTESDEDGHYFNFDLYYHKNLIDCYSIWGEEDNHYTIIQGLHKILNRLTKHYGDK